MKFLFGTLVCSILSFATFSQTQQLFTISGNIVSSKDNQPIVAATISCNNISTTSAANGNFKFDNTFKQGKYTVTVTCVGYATQQKNVEVINKNVILFFELQPSAKYLEPLEITSIRANDNAPFSKTNLSKTQLQTLNQGQDLPFVLNQTPSVVVNSDAGNGIGYTGIRIRGTDATRINVTLNGIPYNDAESQGTYFVDLPDFASSANSIQIQRGVGTSSNGTGAFGGTINVNTNELNETKYAEINNGYGSFNSLKNTIKLGTGLIDNHFTIDARLSQIKSDGYVDRASSNLQSAALSTAYISSKSSLRFNVFLGKEKTYQAWNGINAETLDTNRTYNSSGTEKPGQPYNNETDNYWQNHYQLFYNHTVNNNWCYNIATFYTKGYGYYENYNADQKYKDYIPTYLGNAQTDLIKQQWLDNDFYGQIFSVQYKNVKNIVTVGGSWSNYKGNHNGQVIWAASGGFEPNYKYYDVDAKKVESSIYAKWQYNVDANFSLFTDLQYRYVNHDMKGFKANPTLYVDRKFSFVNPKLGVMYNKNNWKTYFSYALANKEPNRDDFEANIYEQPQHEQLHDFEAGIETKNNSYSLGVTAYYMLYKNQLVLTGKINDVGSYTRINVDNSYRAGIELQGGYSFTKWLQLHANLTLSQNKIGNFTEYVYEQDWNTGAIISTTEIPHSNTDISFSPNVISSQQVSIKLTNNFELNLIGKYVGKQYLDNTQNAARKLDAYYTQDVKAILNIPTKICKQLQCIVSVNNIFNKKYQPNGYTYSYISSATFYTENYYYPMAGTNFMISLNIKL